MKEASTSKKKQSTKQEAPDYLCDAISAVEAFDRARLAKSEEAPKLKEKALKLIQQTNKLKGDGYISISKARSILQQVEHRNKVEMAAAKEKKQ